MIVEVKMPQAWPRCLSIPELRVDCFLVISFLPYLRPNIGMRIFLDRLSGSIDSEGWMFSPWLFGEGRWALECLGCICLPDSLSPWDATAEFCSPLLPNDRGS